MNYFFKFLLFFLFVYPFCYASEIFQFQGAVIGYGNMGQLHASYFSKLCGRAVYIIEIEESKIKMALEQGYSVYPSLESLIMANEIDFIAICTPTYLHSEHIKEAAANQLPIFVEKPIVKNLSEVQEIRDLNYPFIFIGEVEHYNPILKEALEFSSAPSSISIKRSVNLDFFIGNNQPWFLDPELSGGIVTDLMIHDITLLIHKFGKPIVEKVECSQNVYSCIDQVNVRLNFKNFQAHLHADWCHKNKEIPISVVWEVKRGDEIKQYICEDYLKPVSIENDPYYLQDKDYLLSLRLSKFPYPLEIYLQAVEVAHTINEYLYSPK